jgi:NADPH-dependent 2,4-dienoyl-CoA reductase/sulfur reductase-like enzyme
VLVSVGIKPATEIAGKAGLELGQSGAIRTDARQITSVPSILAAGDCCEAMHVVTGRPAWVPLGSTANKQGKIAGENAVGGRARFGGVAGTNVTKVFGLEAAQTGLSELGAEAAGLRPASVSIEASSRAPAYPGGSPLHVKIIFEPETGRLLGGQIVGREGAAKRIDTIAAALHAKMSVSELADIDMSYAPPFAPALDPVIIAASQALKKVAS